MALAASIPRPTTSPTAIPMRSSPIAHAVVPVAADLERLDRGPVVGDELEALVARHGAGEQAPLQDLGDVALLLVEPARSPARARRDRRDRRGTGRSPGRGARASGPCRRTSTPKRWPSARSGRATADPPSAERSSSAGRPVRRARATSSGTSSRSSGSTAAASASRGTIMARSRSHALRDAGHLVERAHDVASVGRAARRPLRLRDQARALERHRRLRGDRAARTPAPPPETAAARRSRSAARRSPGRRAAAARARRRRRPSSSRNTASPACSTAAAGPSQHRAAGARRLAPPTTTSPPRSRSTSATAISSAPVSATTSSVTAAAMPSRSSGAARAAVRRCRRCDPLARRALGVAREQQLALVAAPLHRVEDGGADQQRAPLRVALEHRVDQHGQPLAGGAHHLERDLVHLVLHAQQRRVVRLVVDPPAAGQEVLEAAAADEVLARVARPAQERRVDLDDLPARERREVAARRVLVEILGVVLRHAPGAPTPPASSIGSGLRVRRGTP